MLIMERENNRIKMQLSFNNQIINYISKTINMEFEESDIINLAVNIFQNVGIKRYIGHIDALRHEDIYFQIYKIIFPDSMINIFKISESNLTTGQKIQKIIQQISSIIKLDLYHISGEAIAQGNKNHITNWLQLLEALSNNCIVNQNFPGGGGSEPDLDRENYKDFQQDDDYFTVQGVHGQFDKHTYTDEGASDSNDEEGQYYYEDVNKGHINNGGIHKRQNNRNKSRSSSKEDELNKSFDKGQSNSSGDSNLLQPIQSNKRGSNKGKGKKKKVTFKIEESAQGQSKNGQGFKKAKNTIRKDNAQKQAQETGLEQKYGKSTKMSNSSYDFYTKMKQNQRSDSERLLLKKKMFMSKMHKIQQEMERKKINDEIARHQNQIYNANQSFVEDTNKIQHQYKQRTNFVSRKIAERENFISCFAGKEANMNTIKQIFRKQKQNQKRMRRAIFQQQERDALDLMDLGFASQVQNMVMEILGE